MNLRKFRWLIEAYFNRHRFLSILILVAFLSLVLIGRYIWVGGSALQALSIVEHKKYSEGLVGIPKIINPLLASTDSEKDLSVLLFRGLTKSDLTGQTTADLAESWQISPSGQEYLFHLKKGLKFQNGLPLTAHDVAFTYQLAQNPKYNTKYSDTFKNLSVEVLDDHSLVFHLKESYSPFLSLTSLGILSQQDVQKDLARGVDFNNLSLATSASTDFKLKSLTSNQAVLTKDAVEYTFRFYQDESELAAALKQGDIKAAGFTTSINFNNWKNYQVLSSPLYQRFVGVFYNERKTPTSDRNIRQGLSYAINRPSLIDNTVSGAAEQANSPIAPISWAKDTNLRHYDYSPDQAKASLDKTGWTGGPVRTKDGKELTISLSFLDSPEEVKIANAIAQNWLSAGVRVLLNPLSAVDFQAKVVTGKNFDAALFTEETTVDPDQYILWHTTQINSANVSGMSLPKLDKSLEDARHSLTDTDRMASYMDFQRFLLDDAPVTILFYPKYTYVVSTSVQGINLNPLGLPSDRFVNISAWKIGSTLF